MDFDNQLKHALTPIFQPEKRLNENILRRVKEQEQMNKKSVWKKAVVVMASLICLFSVSAFSFGKFSDIKGDEAAFRAVYQGEGVVAVHVTNSSNKDLIFEERVKLMKWMNAELIEPVLGTVVFEGTVVKAGTEAVMMLDLAGAYDVESLEEPLEAGNWYYLVFTNNHFAFGQDWMVTVDFSEEKTITVEEKPLWENVVDIPQKVEYEGELKVSEWVWPTESRVISGTYGENPINGVFSDHVNIAGEKGDMIYAVTDGTISDAGFDSSLGNYIELTDENAQVVTYGHLDKILVEVGDMVAGGDTIGEMGKTGMATGVNLFFAVYADDKSVNPLKELE